MKSPLIILIELFIGLIRSVLDTMQFTVVKLIELFISLGFIAGTSPFGLVVAVAIGTTVLLAIAIFVGSIAMIG